ncbi:CD209 antigen-like [Sardina pilchardus]|uniref:CD209 antigen-like n=1 Tax=Sardina pilchardus TaxID=27697 RepID=UPI002E0D7358
MGVLLVIFLTGLRIKYTIEITQERDELLSNYSTLMQEKEELLIKYTISTSENNDTALTKSNDQFLSKICSKGLNFHGKSYLISSIPKPWSEARQVCQAMGADLVTIESEEEQVYINGLGRWGWIGLQRHGMSWTWVNGRPLSTGAAFWATGQPNSNTENCTLFLPEPEYPTTTWHDYPCSSAFYPFCEISAN